MSKLLTKAGRYEILEEIGRGSMGVVYAGFDPVIGRKVAIKTMRTDSLRPGDFAEYKARFQREAQSAGILSHPNIVTVYDFGEDDGLLYLTMEFLEGRTLDKQMEEKRVFSPDSIIPMFEQIASALHYAHSRQIIHRDVKPANIMVLSNGMVKVTDFGIAKIMSLGMTQTGGILGTPNYMSPEQVTGKPVDGRSDIFSLGVILYEMVTGAKPFGGENITTVIYRIVNEDPIPPRELDSSIHPGLAQVISKALSKDPDDRYRNCLEFIEELKHFRSLGNSARAFATVPINVAALPPTPAKTSPGRALTHSQQKTLPKLDSPISRQPAPETYPMEREGSRGVWMVLGLVLLCAAAAGAYYFAPSLRQWAVARGLMAPPASQRVIRVRQAAQHLPASAPSPSSPLATLPLNGRPEASASKLEQSAANALLQKQNVTYERATPRHSESISPVADVGTLKVTSDVAGASISLDDQTRPQWVTPYTFTGLAPGSHDVMVAKDGYEGASRRITVVAGRTRTLNLKLAAPIGVVKLMTSPPGVDVRIDGKDYGPSPVRVELAAGRHTYVLRQGSNISPEHSFVLQPGGYLVKLASFDILSNENGVVDIRTIPPGATVIVDGGTVRNHTPTDLSLRPGNHILILSKAGYQPFRDVVSIRQGRSIPVEVLLRPLVEQ